MNKKNERETEEAIVALEKVATYNGSSIEMRKEAIQQLGSFMPHPKAMGALTSFVSGHHYPEELRLLAIQNLGK